MFAATESLKKKFNIERDYKIYDLCETGALLYQLSELITWSHIYFGERK